MENFDRNSVIAQLAALPKRIHEAEKAILVVSADVNAAVARCEKVEAQAIQDGKITGKNETERKAQLKSLTEELRNGIAIEERALKEAVAEHNRVVNEFRALRSIAALIGGEAVS